MTTAHARFFAAPVTVTTSTVTAAVAVLAACTGLAGCGGSGAASGAGASGGATSSGGTAAGTSPPLASGGTSETAGGASAGGNSAGTTPAAIGGTFGSVGGGLGVQAGGSPPASGGAPSAAGGAPSAGGGGASRIGVGGGMGMVGTGGAAAPSTDTSTFGLNGPSKCTGSPFTICEDFEATAVGAIPTGWTKEGSWAAVVSDTDKARGSHALQIQVGVTNNQRGFLNKTAAQLGPLATKHFGRIFFKLQKPPSKFIHWDFFHGPGTLAGSNNDVRWGFTGTGTFTYLYNVQQSQGELGNNAPDKLVIDTWICAEWSLDSTVAGGGEARFWLNGTEVPSLHRTGAQAVIPVFKSFGIGWELFNSTDTPSVAYIDEVVFNATRIGCNN